jgi:hypothetical protein
LTAARTQPKARARLSAWAALTRVFEGDIDGAERDARALLAEDDDVLDRALALDALALAAGVRGRYVEAEALISESARTVEAIGSREAYDSCPHMVLGLQLARLDRLDEAYAAIQRGRRASEALGMVDTLASFQYELALVDLLRGRLDDALAELTTHQELAEQTGAGWSIPADSVRALIALHRGDLLAAERLVSAAERAAAAGGPRHSIDLMVLARSRVLEADGAIDAALDAVDDAFQMAKDAGAASYFPVLAPAFARLAAITGNASRAAPTIPALERIAELNPGVRSLEAAALQARGWLTPDPSALLDAAELLRGTGRVLEAARAAEDAGAALAAQQPEIARGLLERARTAYEDRGASRDLTRSDDPRGRRRGTSATLADPNVRMRAAPTPAVGHLEDCIFGSWPRRPGSRSSDRRTSTSSRAVSTSRAPARR